MKSNREWARPSINIEPALAELVKKRAAAQRRSVSAYLATLIEADLRAHGLLTSEADVKNLAVAEGATTPGAAAPIDATKDASVNERTAEAKAKKRKR